MALTKVSGGILDPGINVAGIVTATGFDGPFTGGSTKNITAGVVTATSLDLNGNGDISGNLVVGGNLTANGDFTTLNTTLREVELLRVDAQNDNVAAGIITQRGTGDILNLYDNTTEVFSVEDGGKVKIGMGALGTNTSDYDAAANNLIVGTGSGDEGITILSGQSVGHHGSIFFADGTGATNSKRGQIRYEQNSERMKFFTAGTQKLTIDINGKVGIGSDIPSQKLDVTGTILTRSSTNTATFSYNTLRFQTSGGAHIDHGTTNQNLNFRVSKSSTADTTMVQINAASEQTKFHKQILLGLQGGGDTTVIGGGSGIGAYIQLNYANNNIVNTKLMGNNTSWLNSHYGNLGIGTQTADEKFQVRTGTHKFISFTDAEHGSLSDLGSAIIFSRPSNGAKKICGIFQHTNQSLGIGARDDLTFHTGGNAFYYSGTEKLSIRSDGEVRIPTGSNSTSRLTFGGGINIYHDGNMKFENATGYLKLQSNNNLYIDGDEIFLRNEGGTNRWKIDSSGHFLPGAVGSYNIGSTGAEVGHIYVADSKTIWIGSDQDLRIAHDPTHTVSYIQNTGTFQIQTDDLRLYNFSTADLYLRATTNAAVQLYYDSSTHATPKLETSATGITVDGEVAASQDYPNFRPTLDLNFAAEKKLDPGITYSRTGPASFVNKFGKVVLVGDNAPRFDHDPTTRESKGILIEESRTNQMKYSSDITDNGSQNSGYTVTNGTVTGNQTTAPDGTTTADQFACNTTNSLHRVSIYFSSGQISNSTAYTFSVFVKANGYDKLHIRYGGYNADNHGLGYDLSDGTTFAGRFDGTGLLSGVTSSSMIAYPNGWYRCTFTFTTASDAATGSAGIFYYISNSESTTNFAGDGSSGMYFWGAQMEVGSFPTSYIPTNGRTVTRGDESLKMDGEDFSNFYNETEGTVITQHEILKNQTNMGLVTFSKDFGSVERIEARATASNSGLARFEVVTGSSSVVSMGGPPHNGIGVGKNNKYAFAFKKDDFTATLNGVNSQSDTSGNMPTGINSLLIGDAVYAVRSSLYIKTIIYYPKRLPDSQLVTLTS